MLTMSQALAVSQATTYYEQSYTSTSESYYTEGDRLQGEWRGHLATEMNLSARVEKEQYERLCQGRHPVTGEQLVRHVEPRTYLNKYGEEVTASEHRAGWDATFSAPKSVSLAALVGRDERLRQAHRESVDLALEELEKYTQARMGGKKAAQATGKMVAAKFEHDAARPDRTTGYAAPQLHTHVVIFNLTQTAEGRVKPLQEIELYRSQRYATTIYRMSLAERLQRLGYEVEIDSRTGAPEITGFSRAYLAESSPRRQEIRKEAEEMKERLERAGARVKEGAGLYQAAARADRADKRYDRELMRERHQEMDMRHGRQAERAVQEAIRRGPLLRQEAEIAKRAQEAVTFARQNAIEREAVRDFRRVVIDALRRNMALTTYEAVKRELAACEARGELIGITRNHQPRETTTRRMMELEQSNIQKMLNGRGQHQPMMEADDVRRTVEKIAAGQGLKLNRSQRAAVEQLLTSRDQIIGLQGGAGTGKTTTLFALREAAESEGYQVRGLAPTTRAAQRMAESGIETETWQKFLRRRDKSAALESTRRLYVLDESSLASTKNLHHFFGGLTAHDKVLLVGDARKHQEVEAGSPFEQLQQQGMETAKLTKAVRRRDPGLRQAVEKLSAKEVKEAVEQLQIQGRVIEVADEKRRLQAIAVRYCDRPDGTLVISPANQEQVALNTLIHQRLQAQGKISLQEHPTRVYVVRQEMTGTERTFANSYVAGEDTVRYNRASRVYGVKAGDYGRVVATDHAQNTITVALRDGREITYNPERLSGVSVYKEAQRTFAEGDRVQFRAPLTGQRVANSELGTIEKIEGDRFTIELDRGRNVTFDAGEYRHLDHGYAVTSYSSQGQTVDRVIVHADTKESDLLLNQRMAYVAIARAKEEALVYTDSKEGLGEALDRRVDKQMAVEAIRHPVEVAQHESNLDVNDDRSAGTEAQATEMAISQGMELIL